MKLFKMLNSKVTPFIFEHFSPNIVDKAKDNRRIEKACDFTSMLLTVYFISIPFFYQEKV